MSSSARWSRTPPSYLCIWYFTCSLNAFSSHTSSSQLLVFQDEHLISKLYDAIPENMESFSIIESKVLIRSAEVAAQIGQSLQIHPSLKKTNLFVWYYSFYHAVFILTFAWLITGVRRSGIHCIDQKLSCESRTSSRGKNLNSVLLLAQLFVRKSGVLH